MNITDKSIKELYDESWGDSDFDSYVVNASQLAREKPISSLSKEEIRLLIGQKIGLKYIIPLAISIIRSNPLIGITYFEGDLLLQLLRLSIDDWKENTADLQEFKTILQKNHDLIASCENIPMDSLKTTLCNR